MWIREAQPTEAEARAVTDLVLRSKAHWGYDTAFLARCRQELTVTAADVRPRRIVVAEDDGGGLLAVASLEGEPPHGALGLLFVAPEEIGRGLGRTLYAHVLEDARALGFTALTIDADPHAVGFYRALGARPLPDGGGALPRLAVDLAPRPAWARAWADGRRAVHLGNVAEFQAQFAGAGRRPRPAAPPARFPAADHYACLAAFASPHPVALALPARVPAGWIDLVARQLRWARVEVYDRLDEAALLAQGGFGERWRDRPFVAWGHTDVAARLAGRRLPADALRHESKAESHALFRRLAPDHPGIRVPDRWPAATRRAAARLIAARARSGARTVVKTAHGAGGSGTRIATGRVRALSLPPGPLLVEEYVTGDGTHPTYDGLVDARGTVHDVGVASMDMGGPDGTAYRGATVGPGAVPDRIARPALRFGRAVGRALAADGYRGWFDVDFVTGDDGLLAPVETNLRLTGPSVAFMIKLRLDETRGGDHLVRCVDRVDLGARLPDGELMAFLTGLTERCAGVDAVLIPTIPSAAYDPAPYVGVAVAARTLPRLDAAASLTQTSCAALSGVFTRA
ncbi:GNAT family N-acetyltransferase [Streptomyces sp. NPDC003860]